MLEKPNKTIITIVLPTSDEESVASIAIKQGTIGHVSSFTPGDFGTLCRALNTGLSEFANVQANPPNDIKSAAKEVEAKTKSNPAKARVKKDKPAGKAPYHFLNVAGKRRELMTMIDPYEVTEKCLKNRKLSFKELADAEEVAQMLVDAGEKRITIVYKNGKTAKVVGEPLATQAVSDDSDTDKTDADENLEDNGSDYPDGIQSDLQGMLYDHLKDVKKTVDIDSEITRVKKHDWTNNLIKQREVKAAIAKHIDDEAEVEVIYELVFKHKHAQAPSGDDLGESGAEKEVASA